MTSNSTNEAPSVSQDVVMSILAREEEYSPQFLDWLTNKLFNTLDEHLKKAGTPPVVGEALDTLQVLNSLHACTLQGQGAGFKGASEYVASATRLIEQLGGDFFREV